ncbi:MAG: 1-acyl-sn-glycerol-3-phosphate acyltransferase [Spirochaetales bacterium]|nr:1-acyl-sn-glycerol-3-phosphate acyltransferase [Spirochaetales bacterium]
MRHLFYWFFVITAYPIYGTIFRTKLYYEDRSVQGRRIRKRTVVVSNHRKLFDYVAFLLATVPRFSHPLVAEVLYHRNRVLDFLLSAIGSIEVDRETHTTNALVKSIQALKKGQVLYVNAEGRLPLEGETDVNPFNPGFVVMALKTGAQVVPVFTNGMNFTRHRVRMMIGKPIDVQSLYDESLGLRENTVIIAETVRRKVVELGVLLEERTRR